MQQHVRVTTAQDTETPWEVAEVEALPSSPYFCWFLKHHTSVWSQKPKEINSFPQLGTRRNIWKWKSTAGIALFIAFYRSGWETKPSKTVSSLLPISKVLISPLSRGHLNANILKHRQSKKNPAVKACGLAGEQGFSPLFFPPRM